MVEKKRKVLSPNELNPFQALLLLLMGIDNKPVKGRTWLQKEMFLIVNNIEGMGEISQYEPHHYGPYSELIEIQLENLKSYGLIFENKEITLTREGKLLFQELLKMSSPELLELISEIKKDLNDLTQDELLAYIYFAFPEMTKESRVIDKIRKKRLKLAISLYKKGKVSLSKAAEIAGKPLPEFMRLLRQKKMKIPLSY